MDIVNVLLPVSSTGVDSGKVIVCETVVVWPAAITGTLMLPIVTSDPLPSATPAGVRTTSAVVAGEGALPALAMVSLTMNSPPHEVSVVESWMPVPTSETTGGAAMVTREVSKPQPDPGVALRVALRDLVVRVERHADVQ